MPVYEVEVMAKMTVKVAANDEDGAESCAYNEAGSEMLTRFGSVAEFEVGTASEVSNDADDADYTSDDFEGNE